MLCKIVYSIEAGTPIWRQRENGPKKEIGPCNRKLCLLYDFVGPDTLVGTRCKKNMLMAVQGCLRLQSAKYSCSAKYFSYINNCCSEISSIFSLKWSGGYTQYLLRRPHRLERKVSKLKIFVLKNWYFLLLNFAINFCWKKLLIYWKSVWKHPGRYIW